MNRRLSRQIILLTSLLALMAFTLASPTGNVVVAVEPNIRLESASLGPRESVPLSLEGRGFDATGVGAITLDVSYDPKTVSVTACFADPEEVFDLALCNQEYAEGVVRVTAIDAQGEAGDFSLAEITFTAGTEPGTQTLGVRVETLADPTGNELEALVENGALSIAGDSAAGESPPESGDHEEGTNSGSAGEQEAPPDEAFSNEQSGQDREPSDDDTSAESSGAEAVDDQARGSAEEDSESAESGASGASDASSEEEGEDSTSGFRWWYAGVAVIVGAVATMGIAFARTKRQA